LGLEVLNCRSGSGHCSKWAQLEESPAKPHGKGIRGNRSSRAEHNWVFCRKWLFVGWILILPALPRQREQIWNIPPGLSFGASYACRQVKALELCWRPGWVAIQGGVVRAELKARANLTQSCSPPVAISTKLVPAASSGERDSTFSNDLLDSCRRSGRMSDSIDRRCYLH
jgi:hypothetical protein